MRVLLNLMAAYKRSKILGWIGQQLRFVEDPRKRLKLLEFRQKLLKIQYPTLALMAHYEKKYEDLITGILC